MPACIRYIVSSFTRMWEYYDHDISVSEDGLLLQSLRASSQCPTGIVRYVVQKSDTV